MFIVGHRGARALAPENTLKAIRIGMGCADLIEVDIRCTHEGIPVIMHDPAVDRTTNGRGMVNELMYTEIKRLDAGQGEHVPTLNEVIETVRGKCGLIVEFKEERGVDRVVASVLGSGISPCWFVSFHPAPLCRVRELSPVAKTGFIFSRSTNDPLSAALTVKATAIFSKFVITGKELVERAHAAGLLVVVWTLNSIESFVQAESFEIDGISTDDPCFARLAMSRYSRS